MLSGAKISHNAPPPGAGVLGIIPARLASSRLPRKPLTSIAGRPLIEWVWRRAASLDSLTDIVVATDDQEVLGVVERCGGRAVLTRKDHASGTDRVAEVAARPEYRDYDWIVNLQGDQLFLPAAALDGAVQRAQAVWDVGTAAVPVASAAEWQDSSVVKVVCDDRGGALYFSRAPIPHLVGDGGAPPDGYGHGRFLRHLGIYAFSRAVLRRAVAHSSHPLEELEGLEQLRWLAAGWRIGVAVVREGGLGIDTEYDVVRAEELLRERQEAQ